MPVKPSRPFQEPQTKPKQSLTSAVEQVKNEIECVPESTQKNEKNGTKIIEQVIINIKFKILTLRHPLRRKLRRRWFFDISKVKESSFVKSDLTDPLRFLMRIFWKVPIQVLPDFIFQWVLYQDHLSQMILQLIRTNEIGA